MRIALYGGSFNPVHKGHILLAEYAIRELNLDELIFIPCYRSTDKEQNIYASAEHRVNMLKLVLPEKCSISDYEILKKEAIESIETAKHFRNIYKKNSLFFLIGDDNLETIDTWQDYRDLDKYVDMVIFRRKKKDIKVDSKGLRVIYMDNELWDASSSKFRKEKTWGMLDSRVAQYIRDKGIYNLPL